LNYIPVFTPLATQSQFFLSRHPPDPQHRRIAPITTNPAHFSILPYEQATLRAAKPSTIAPF
jgi:hypothetical protein